MKGGSLRDKRHELDSLKRKLTAAYRSGEPENDDYAEEAERLYEEVNEIENTLRNMRQSVVDIEKQIETTFNKKNKGNAKLIIRLLKIVKNGLKYQSKHDTVDQRNTINENIRYIQEILLEDNPFEISGQELQAGSG